MNRSLTSFSIAFFAFLSLLCVFTFQIRSQGLYPGAVDPSFFPGWLHRETHLIFLAGFPDNSLLVCEDYKLRKLKSDGSLDYTFRSPPGDFVSELTAPSGDVIVCRQLPNQYRPETTEILWLEADGSISKRISLPALEAPSFNVQPDGKILTISGALNYPQEVSRFNRDGSFDPTFNSVTRSSGGLPTSTVIQKRILVQADGRLIITGNFMTWGDLPRKGIVRLNADGSLDRDYAPGLLLNGVEYIGAPCDAVLQGDGKLVVVGNFATAQGQGRRFIARFKSDGTLDPSLYLDPSIGSFTGSLNIKVLPDTSLIFGGNNFVLHLDVAGGIIDRYQPVPADLLTVRRQGDIITAFFYSDNFFLLKPDGGWDPAFNRPAVTRADRVIPDNHGKLWLGGAFPDGRGGFFVGIAALQENGAYQPFLISPYVNYSSTTLTHFAFQGEKLLSFLTGKLQRVDSGGNVDSLFKADTGSYQGPILVTPDQKILIQGYLGQNTDWGLMRLLPNGEKDATFQPYKFYVSSMEIVENGQILVGGYSAAANHSEVLILNDDGSRDPTFNAGAMTTFNWLIQWPQPATIYAATKLPSGNVLVIGNMDRIEGGDFPNGVGVAVFDRTGKVVNNFKFPPGTALAKDAEDRLLIAAGSLLRFLPDGTEDPLFSPVSFSTLRPDDHSRYPSVSQIVVDRSDRIVVAGDFDLVNGMESPNVVRLIGGSNITGPRFRPLGRGIDLETYVIDGRPSASCVIEQTADWKNWVPFMTIAPFTGRAEVSLPPNFTARFFRAKIQP
jgi:uncharacterized delta-60 repeat protein